MLTNQQRATIIKDHQHAEADCGSTEVQVALISARIRDLQDHFTTHKKDVHSRVGLRKLVSQRRKLLNYLKSRNLAGYRQLIEKLGIRG
jgi:small subunit ribosomal protein S15